jgi:hypothetical protein
MSELYAVLILKGLGWLLMARFTSHSHADVAQMWPTTWWSRRVITRPPYLLIRDYPQLPGAPQAFVRAIARGRLPDDMVHQYLDDAP